MRSVKAGLRGLLTLHLPHASNIRHGCTAHMAALLQAAVNRQEAAEAQTQLRHLQRQQTQHHQQLEHELEQAQVRAATAVQEREAMHATLRQGGSAAAGAGCRRLCRLCRMNVMQRRR